MLEANVGLPTLTLPWSKPPEVKDTEMRARKDLRNAIVVTSALCR